jgi:hypothetical protein
MTYFHRRSAYYHWRGSVSPSCSGWEGVVPLCYGRQTKGWESGFGSWPRIRIVWGAVDPGIFSRLLYVTQVFTGVSGRRCWVVTASHTHTACFSKL